MASVDPVPEQFEDLRVFGRHFHCMLLCFGEVAVERALEVAGVEAQKTFEDFERALVFVRTDFDFDEGVECGSDGDGCVSWACGEEGRKSYAGGNWSGFDGGGMFWMDSTMEFL